ncbi:MAG: F0F1 ATP synthase subunit B [Mariprofundaceae bacterium]
MSIDLTFIAQIVVFLVMVTVMWKLLYRPLNDLMEARSRKIAEGLAAAEAGIEAKAKAEAEIAKQLEEARTRAHEIIAAAEKRAVEINEQATERARREAEQIVDAAREEVQAELARARQALRDEVASIALLAAERIVEAELDAKRHAKLIESVIEKGMGG